jgi:hypothetical protein
MRRYRQLKTPKETLLRRLAKVGGALAACFGALTTAFWFLLCVGSWQDDRPLPANSGCIEFDLRPSILGHNVAPNQQVFTDYTNGYVLGNMAFFDFQVFRPNVGDDPTKGVLSWLRGNEDEEATNKPVKTEFGTARISINPFTLSFKVYNKTNGFGDRHYNGYRESSGVSFKWQQAHCP